MSRRLLPLGQRLFRLPNGLARSALPNRPYCYKSSIALENLYPNSSLKITTPEFTPLEPESKFSGYIPIDKLKITYSCSSGPGGQNVNKVATKVDLRFKVSEAEWLDPEIRGRLMREHANKISKDGYLIFKSDTTRLQTLNLADCMRKLRDVIRKAAAPAPTISPETLDRLRKRKEKANRERLMVKRIASEKRMHMSTPTVHDL